MQVVIVGEQLEEGQLVSYYQGGVGCCGGWCCVVEVVEQCQLEQDQVEQVGVCGYVELVE